VEPVTGKTLAPAGFRHEALFYESDLGFLSGTVPYVQAALAAREPVLVMLGPEKSWALERALGDVGDRVHYADIDRLGCNPARVIPVWREFLEGCTQFAGTVCGISEPVLADCRPDEMVECRRHEELLNIAFGAQWAPSFKLLCPYDMRHLSERATEVARRTHSYLSRDGFRTLSPEFVPSVGTLLDAPLPRPRGETQVHSFEQRTLGDIRMVVAQVARAAGLDEDRATNMVLAVNELTSNSVRYGGGTGLLRVWTDRDSLFCEVRDGGTIVDPLVGCVRPRPYQERGRGLWMVNQLCDVVQLRSSSEGTVVRVSARRRPCPPDCHSRQKVVCHFETSSSSGC
jgi:anti-sigma regulatory factor (Ser/Thr protein kinase)